MDPPANKEKIGVLPRKPRKKRTKKTPGGRGAGEQEPSATESNSRTKGKDIGTSSKSKSKEHSGAGGRGIGGHGETKRAAPKSAILNKTQGSPTVSSSSALTHYLESHDAPLAKSKYNKTASGGSSVSSAMYSGLMTEDMIWLAEAGAAPPAKQSTLETIEGENLESEYAVPTQEVVPPTVSSALTHYLAGHDAPLARYHKTASGGSSTVSSAMYMTEDRIWLAEADAAPSAAKQSARGTIEGENLESE
ncbi:hypothetical protein THAOC_06701, partial [Thalassiosira oceanica]